MCVFMFIVALFLAFSAGTLWVPKNIKQKNRRASGQTACWIPSYLSFCPLVPLFPVTCPYLATLSFS